MIEDDSASTRTAEILDLDGVAARRELFLAHAAAASQVAIYDFLIPEGATTHVIGGHHQQRDARDQLQFAVAVTGGAIGQAWRGLRVRVPVTAASRFEALAKFLIDAFLVAYQR